MNGAGHQPRCLYYAFGGGLGHGMRSLALARRLARRRGGVHQLLVNTPWVRSLRQAVDDRRVEILAFSPEATPLEARRWVLAEVESYRPDLLVVDTFPRGLGGEFKDFLSGWRSGLRVWTHRGLPERYVREFDLGTWIAAAFDSILAPGGKARPSGASQLPCLETGPWMVRRRDELWTPATAAQRLGCQLGERCELYVGTGTPVECLDLIERFRRALDEWRAGDPPLRLALPVEIEVPNSLPANCIVRHSPLIELFLGVGRIVGNAGFHLFHETRWLGIPARWIARPRRYDDQRQRLDDSSREFDGDSAEDGQTQDVRADYDGTDRAVEALERWLDQRRDAIQRGSS